MAALIDENTQFVDSGGEPIVNGKLYIGTKGLDPKTNLITIYSDRALTTVLANPQLLDANGRSANKIWVPSTYSLQVDNSNDVQQLQDLDAGDIQQTGTTILTDVQGTNTITASAVPTADALVDGQAYILEPANTNTGATTLNIDSLGAKAIVANGLAIGAGGLVQGRKYILLFNEDNDQFDLVGAADTMPTGGGGDEVFYENEADVTEDYTLTENAMSVGPVSVAAGKKVTVPTGKVWKVI